MAAAAAARRAAVPAPAARSSLRHATPLLPLLLLLLIAAAAPAAGQDLRATLALRATRAVRTFGWEVIAQPPSPLALQIPVNGSGSVAYSVTYRRQLKGIELTVGGNVTFENRGVTPAILGGGDVTVCNGFFADIGSAKDRVSAADAGCSGSSFSIPLDGAAKVRVPPGGQAAVLFSGTVNVNAIVSARIANGGISGPVASGYVDAFLAGGRRVASRPARVTFDMSTDAQDMGAIATAYDEFVDAAIPPLTARPVDVVGSKIPDGIGMRIADTETMSYKAIFKFVPGTTPCGIPLTAVNQQRLVVDNPGDTPLPQPQTTQVTILFTGCARKSEARFGRIIPEASPEITWALTKTANASLLRVKSGQSGAVQYKVVATRATRAASYTLSGSVFVTPKGGRFGVGAPPLDVKSVDVSLSSGDTAKAYCLPPLPDNSTECRFDKVSYSIAGMAPVAGSASAVVTLADGGTLQVKKVPFDFTALPFTGGARARAELTDTFGAAGLAAAAKGGLELNFDQGTKLPSEDEGMLATTDGGVYTYVVKIGGKKAKCGAYKLSNVAKLAQKGAQPLTARADVTVEVYGC